MRTVQGDMVLRGEDDTLRLGQKLARSVYAGEKIYLHGDLGAGKTTLVRGFLQAMGHKGAVRSPTYSLVEHYFYKNLRVFHFDLYRLGDASELEYMGIRDYFFGNSVCLVEWADRGRGVLPAADIEVKLEYSGTASRRAHLESHTAKGQSLLQKVLNSPGP
ncbi:MAG: tRNA (adenosine(37)-N6)-threonylcarbamoyltransferase complex ATPase subunit type 1 TsaE [Gammaproteobacteria bacterium]|nr:tRNA (adenosine(37)-N6)-threonylcarbamoyltransferase complex ATPase subunit type 1 TsaE [Gammaproteobacteria bacterium]